MKTEQESRLQQFDELEQSLERSLDLVREQRREFINQHDLNKVKDDE